MQNSGTGNRYCGLRTIGYGPRATHRLSRFTFHVSRIHLLLVVTVLLRPGPDEQADAGDGAFRAAVTGLLAPAPPATRDARLQTQGSVCPFTREAPFPRPLGGFLRCDPLGAERRGAVV